MADITGRECINRGLPGQGVQTMYWQLSEGRIKKNFPNVKYFIYVYLDDHIHNRILKFRCFPFMYSVSMKYRINNNKLEIIKQHYGANILIFTVSWKILNQKLFL